MTAILIHLLLIQIATTIMLKLCEAGRWHCGAGVIFFSQRISFKYSNPFIEDAVGELKKEEFISRVNIKRLEEKKMKLFIIIFIEFSLLFGIFSNTPRIYWLRIRSQRGHYISV